MAARDERAGRRSSRRKGRQDAASLAAPPPETGPFVQLAPGRDEAIRRGHPWVLSGSVARVSDDARDGESLSVVGADGETLGRGDFAADSQIRTRVWHFGSSPAPGEDEWLESRIDRALALRARDPALDDTEGQRLINAEGDGLPGLVVDRYADWLVMKPTTRAMQLRAPALAKRLEQAQPVHGVWLRGDARSPGVELAGEVPHEPITFRERRRSYAVDLRHGQKTGFYLDQRDARDRFQSLAQGRSVLDLYAYSGGFSVAALAGGARRVVAVESSAQALELLAKNAPEAQIVAGDAAAFAEEAIAEFDLIVIDPPPFARRRRDVQAAARAYREGLARVIRGAPTGALVMGFTCSHHVGPELYRTLSGQAAAAARRDVRLLESFGAPADHPVSAVHPEGRYLSGLLLEVGERR